MRTWILGVLATLPLALASLAQPTQTSPVARPAGTPAVNDRAPEPTFNIDFPGGTVAEYVALLRRESAKGGGAPVNVTVTEAAAQCRVPRVELTSVTAEGAVMFLSRGDNVGDTRLFVDQTASDREHRVYAIFMQGRGPAAASKPNLLVVALSDLISAKGAAPEAQDRQLQAILSAIETALKIGASGSGQPAQLTVHKESGLLIMRGSDAERAIATDVLAQIRATMLNDEGAWHTKTIELLNVEAREVVEAILDVYPDRQNEGPRSIRYEIVNPKQLKVSAPDRVMSGIDALVTLIDRVRSSPRAVERAQAQVEDVRQHAELQVAALRDALKRSEDMMRTLQQEVQARSVETMQFQSQATSLNAENARLRKLLDEKK